MSVTLIIKINGVSPIHREAGQMLSPRVSIMLLRSQNGISRSSTAAAAAAG